MIFITIFVNINHSEYGGRDRTSNIRGDRKE